jgi:hypothetical protein
MSYNTLNALHKVNSKSKVAFKAPKLSPAEIASARDKYPGWTPAQYKIAEEHCNLMAFILSGNEAAACEEVARLGENVLCKVYDFRICHTVGDSGVFYPDVSKMAPMIFRRPILAEHYTAGAASVLFVAILKGQEHVIDAILSLRETNIDLRSDPVCHPLMACVMVGASDLFERLLRYKYTVERNPVLTPEYTDKKDSTKCKAVTLFDFLCTDVKYLPFIRLMIKCKVGLMSDPLCTRAPESLKKLTQKRDEFTLVITEAINTLRAELAATEMKVAIADRIARDDAEREARDVAEHEARAGDYDVVGLGPMGAEE